MPDTAQLTKEVHDLNERLTVATEQMAAAVVATQAMTKEYVEDKRFKTRIIRVLTALAIGAVIVAGLAGWAAKEAYDAQRADAAIRCERSQQLRADIHAGLDAVLDEIHKALPDEQTGRIVESAKIAVRKQIPFLDCDGLPLTPREPR